MENINNFIRRDKKLKLKLNKYIKNKIVFIKKILFGAMILKVFITTNF